LARVGGDEFALLLPVFNIADGYATAERLHREICKGMGDWPYDVTCSMGAIVVEHGTPDTEDTFIAMADSLMYEVKRAGKNALRVAHVDLDMQASLNERLAA
jgi:diguanylate cyclase (GGDEF)-like protein